MNQSAIYKIEKGEPRRRITVDELMGFAAVFNTNVSDLLLSRDIGEDAHAAQLYDAWAKAERAAEAARREFEEYSGEHPEVYERVRQAASERPAARRG
jgi:hypothetical protein